MSVSLLMFGLLACEAGPNFQRFLSQAIICASSLNSVLSGMPCALRMELDSIPSDRRVSNLSVRTSVDRDDAEGPTAVTAAERSGRSAEDSV